jgi:preprotein translocase subunit SecG
VLTALIVVVTVVTSLALIFLVLMHSGRGGGISDLFGGSVTNIAQGSTVAERNLDRITVAVALVFGFSVLALDLRLQ